MRRALLSVAASLALLAACHRNDEPTSEPAPRPVVSPATSASGVKPTLPPAERTAMLPVARDPDLGLDPADPARDYVTRYLRATKRYAAQAPCVVVKASTFATDKSVVETANDPSGTCGKAGELRDRFFVNVATDRMSLDASLHQPKLQPWPDGSDPDGPAGKVSDLQDLRKWRTGLRDAFKALQLAPLRVQVYGRGTYPVISIAGWHGPVLRTMSPAELEGPAKALCTANDGDPLGILAGLDRATLLRITCPGAARFDSLQ
jgi:hypothetical protein